MRKCVPGAVYDAVSELSVITRAISDDSMTRAISDDLMTCAVSGDLITRASSDHFSDDSHYQ